MKRIGLIVNTQRPRAGEVLQRIDSLAEQLGLQLFGGRDLASFGIRYKALSERAMLKKVEGLLAIGGDGTVLRAARALDGVDKPLMGINIGSLGFMTSVSEDEIEPALRSLASNRYVTSLRTMLDAEVRRGGRTVATYRALNDVVIHTGANRKVIHLAVRIGKEDVTTYVCDGLIASTPTGSTGHGLSAGGPILTPDAPVFVVGLICPHTLSSRPLVVADRHEIAIRLSKGESDSIVKADGQVGTKLRTEDVVILRRSRSQVLFIHLPGYQYFAVLRHKLHWKGSTLSGL